MLDLQDFEKNMRQGSTPTTIGWGKDPAFFSGQVYVQEAAQNESVNQNDLWCLFLVVFTISIFTCMLDILYDHITCGPCSWGWKAKVSSGKLCVDIAHIYTGYIDTVVLCIFRVFLRANCVSICTHTCKSHHSLSVSPSGRPLPYFQ